LLFFKFLYVIAYLCNRHIAVTNIVPLPNTYIYMRPGVVLVTIVLLATWFAAPLAYSQSNTITGTVRDKQSDEPIPFVSLIFLGNGQGTLTDSAGQFWLNYNSRPNDTLVITSVGYIPLQLALSDIDKSTFITIKMDIAPVAKSAVVRVKYDRALWLWRRIMKYKDKHDQSRFDNYAYEVYNKLELDINNVDKKKLEGNRLLKPFNFIITTIDTSENMPLLPVFLTETLSDYYYQRSPNKTRELIKASNTNGVNNTSVTRLLGSTYQNVRIYNDQVAVLNIPFIGPFNRNADTYYKFSLLDTQYLGNKRLVHLGFSPKNKGSNTFEGDCWVVDSVYAIQKITLRPSQTADINFVKNITLIQEFRLVDDTTWFLSKDKFVADIAPLGKERTSFKGRKTATYQNVLLNSNTIAAVLNGNKRSEEISVAANAENDNQQFWDTSRHEPLNRNELAIYHMIDTLQSLPLYKKYVKVLGFLGSGYINVGKLQLGPWMNWVSANNYEGTRVRFDLGTNKFFSKKLYLHAYGAYGFLDKQWKGFGEVLYVPGKKPRRYLYASYTNDLDQGQHYYNARAPVDNILTFAIRKVGVPLKFQRLKELRFEAFTETNREISFKLEVTSREFTPLQNLPGKLNFDPNLAGKAFNGFETAINIRYAYQELFLENNVFRSSLGSVRPIVELRYAKGWAGVLGSSYNYHKLNLNLVDILKVPPIGSIYYNLFGGRIWGTMPYPFLEIHPGNEIYFYNKFAFNMMNRFEFISDRYAGFMVEHSIGNGLFKFIPLTRKMKIRQFWTAKGVTGNLSYDNKYLNFTGAQNFKMLNNKLYMELGTGIDNIFKILRIDFIWRVATTPLPVERGRRFGVFGSFRVSF